MKTLSVSLLAGVLAVALAGCSTVDGRIKDNPSAFNALPPETQQKIRNGQVELGYTPEMVTMALGKPDRTYTRTNEKGSSEIWAYRDKKPTMSFGFGIGGGGGGTHVGSGIGITTGGDRYDDRLRVVFVDGKVSAVETAK